MHPGRLKTPDDEKEAETFFFLFPFLPPYFVEWLIGSRFEAP